MHILLVTPIYSQHYDSGHFWVRALNQLGHFVTVWDYRLDKSPPPFTRYPDLTLVLKGEGLDPHSLPGPRFCYWPDALERTPGIEGVLRGYDKVFTPVRPTPDWMEWLPTGWDPTIHRDLELDRMIDSIYVGTANSPYKVNVVSRIRPTLVFGNNWPREVEPSRSGWSRGPIYLNEMVRWFNASKILINVHQSSEVGLNRKFFEMIACGFTLTDHVPGVEDVLGYDLTSEVVFSSVKHARGMIQYYLEHPKEREILWRREREVIEPYTYLKAAERILDTRLW